MIFLIIAKFEDIFYRQKLGYNCKSGKNITDFTIFSCFSSHIFTLASRNFTKLTQKLCLMIFLIIAKFEDIFYRQKLGYNCKSGKNITDFTIFPCVSSHIFPLASRNFTKLTQKLCLMIFLIIAKFKVILSTGTWLKWESWQKFR